MAPRGRANFDPRAFIWTNLVNTHQTMFHAKYLSSSSFSFIKEDFLRFYYIHIRKSYDPLGWGQFWPHGFYLNKLDRHSLEDVSCQISKLYLFGFFNRRYFKIFLSVAMATRVLRSSEFMKRCRLKLKFKDGRRTAGRKVITKAHPLCDRSAKKNSI
jgi:hypothetical protein